MSFWDRYTESPRVGMETEKNNNKPGTEKASQVIRLRPERPYHVWSYDFVIIWTHGGRQVRLLCITDKYTMEALATCVERSIGAQVVIEILTDLMLIRGVPEHIRSDNCPKFTAKALRAWVAVV